MIEIDSVDELEKFIKTYSEQNIKKRLLYEGNFIIIRLYIFDPEKKEMAEYKVKLEGPAAFFVRSGVENLYMRLNFPKISTEEIFEWE